MLDRIVSVGFAVLLATWAQSASAQTAHWIWPVEKRLEGSAATLRRSFNAPPRLATAQLTGVVDFCRAKVQVNGAVVVTAEGYGTPFQLDVSRWIREGNNELRVDANSDPGPAAIALRLELTPLDGPPQIVITDRTWSSESRVGNPVDQSNVSTDFGEVHEFELDPRRAFEITPIDDYEQWRQALQAGPSTAPSTFWSLPGFQVTLVHSARPEDGSWVSMAFDPQGRLVIGREDRGLLRMTLSADRQSVAKVETIEDSLLECRGLLFAYDSLYVNANNSKGFYRLRDTDGDDRFDEVRLLRKFEGSLGHGRNDVALGPDGGIYLIHGDAVDVPTDCDDRTSPFREHRRGKKSREGYLIRTDREGAHWQLIAAGLRNPYGIAFHADGEPFTYDADAEFDMGSPWYRPTQVKHLVAGADFGWRGVTGQWPPYFPDHPDNAQPNVHIGKGSPTSVKFGYASSFPAPYREALFILDWAYGRIIAVHLTPRGASYVGRPENFLKGRPLNVTDLDFGPDGAMYFVTGGRKTQAGLYRVTFQGPHSKPQPLTKQQEARQLHAVTARTLRRDLESRMVSGAPDALEKAWSYLDHPDPWIRYAARTVVEHQPIREWRERVFQEPRVAIRLAALLALARSGDESIRGRILTELNAIQPLSLSGATTSQRLVALYTYQLCFNDPEKGEAAATNIALRELDSSFPDPSKDVNRPLSLLLAKLNAPSSAAKSMELLRAATDQTERMHYLFVMRGVKSGWTPNLRRAYAEILQQSTSYLGGEGMPGFLKQIRADFVAMLSEEEKKELVPWIDPPTAPAEEPMPSRPMVQQWTIADLETIAAEANRASGHGDRANGSRLFAEALCARCHRVGAQGQLVGPDLTGVSRRFSRRDILQSILEPSLVVAENYRNDRVETTDGRVLIGRIVASGDFRSSTLRIQTDPLDVRKVSEVPKREIVSHTSLPTSPMPAGLLNTLTKDEIRELLLFIEAGGQEEPEKSAR